jgi:hypothetical protein
VEQPGGIVEGTTSGAFPSLPKRLAQVFLSPGELFTALRQKPVWFGALAVAAVLLILSVAVLPTELWVEFSRSQMIERGQEVPPGFEQAGPAIRIFSVLGVGLAIFVMTFIMAGIVTVFFSFLFGDEGRYVQYLAVIAHASIIPALGALFLLPLKLSQGDPSVTLNLGTFAFFMEDGYLYRVLKMLDLFVLWSYVVMAVGVTKIDPRRSFGFALSFFLAFALAFALIFGVWAR